MKRLRCVVIGAGMSGILALIKLKERGHEVVGLEKADNVGGTWRDNRYPGLMCDTPIHTYTFGFETYPDFTRNYVGGEEIQNYFERITDKYDLRPLIKFGQEVSSVKFDGDEWHIETRAGLKLDADIVIVATGVLHHPKIPEFEGLESFEGVVRHTARWDTSLDLSDKRLGVIGSGSTGIQMVSRLAGEIPLVVHFQRSPQWVQRQVHFSYTAEQREEFRRDPGKIDAIRNDPQWWANVHAWTESIADASSAGIKIVEEQCLEHLESSVKDPVLLEKLRPNYRAACKRIVASPDYYARVQLPNVVVEIGKIARIEPKGVRMEDGTFYELDVLALATGFDAQAFIRPATVIGRNGVNIEDAWSTATTAYYAISIPDFPNFFMLNGPSAPVGNFSLTDIAEQQWNYIEQLLEGIEEGRYRHISPTPEAMQTYREAHKVAAARTIFGSGCTSWYLDEEGIPMNWPYNYERFRSAMSKPNFSDFEVG